MLRAVAARGVSAGFRGLRAIGEAQMKSLGADELDLTGEVIERRMRLRDVQLKEVL